ncbi:MAG: SUMF1/EgtB/PvdO family nonheme iron enzyme [Candidatus Hatepunaea meridiana]|nr:SUMF1/EgtB/PvdO family nonheme iron enzyme [Candidatus Hatepunaea meridiana]
MYRYLSLLTIIFLIGFALLVSSCSDDDNGNPVQPANDPPAAPSNPSPADSVENLDVDVILSWDCSDPDGDQLTYNLHFGTSEVPRMVSHDKTESSYEFHDLEYNQIYYWKVIVKDDHGHRTDGPVWRFTTINRPPDVPIDPSPADSVIDQALDITLYWNCNDPDDDSLTYDVFYGTSEDLELVSDNQSEQSYIPEGLEHSTTYYWKIDANDDNLTTEGAIWRFTTAPPGNQPPNEPTTPSPENEASEQAIDVNLDWECSDPEGDPMTYDVYFGTAESPPLVSGDETESSYILDSLEYNQTYYWKIIARDNHNHYREGEIWHFTTLNIVPDLPVNPFPEDGAEEQEVDIVLSWECTDPDGDPLTYDIYLGIYEDEDSLITVSEEQSENSYEPVDLLYRQTYYWKVIAEDSNGGSTESPIWRFTTSMTGNQPPKAPSDPSPEDEGIVDSLDVELSWECIDLDGDTLIFDVFFGTFEDTLIQISADQYETNYNLPDTLMVNTPYYWRIIAKDNHDTTEGAVWNFVINHPPEAPTVLSPVDEATDQMIYLGLSWECCDPDNDLITYEVYLGTTGNPSRVERNLDTCYYEPEDIEYDQTYYWKIAAMDDHGHSIESAVWSFTTAENLPPELPFNPSPEDRAIDQPIDVVLSWECSDPYGDPLTYEVYFGISEEDMERVSSDQDETSFDPEDFEYLPYYWKVVANDGHGLETEGPVWSYATPRERDFELGDTGVNISMIWIPSGAWASTGSFMMGAQPNEQDADDNEYPRHQVTLEYGFWMSKYEVTQAQWVAVMGENPSKSQGDNLPVERVSWNDVQSFISNLERRTPFQLPTEAEWEYACRAGYDETRFPWGEDPDYEQLSDYGWFSENGDGQTHDVGQKQPNPWGLFDMHGNVWEWCADTYHSNYTDAPDDGSAWVERDDHNYIFRGGSWFSNAESCRSAKRSRGGISYFSYTLGFRLVRK